MKKKKESNKLVQRAYDAFKILEETTYKQRMQSLESIEEYGFAILILWSRIEITLKLLKYYHNKLASYPEKLDFINRNWSILKHAYNNQQANYDLVFGEIWKTRNRVAHAAISISKDEYENYKTAAKAFLEEISQNLLTLSDYQAMMKKKKKAE